MQAVQQQSLAHSALRLPYLRDPAFVHRSQVRFVDPPYRNPSILHDFVCSPCRNPWKIPVFMKKSARLSRDSPQNHSFYAGLQHKFVFLKAPSRISWRILSFLKKSADTGTFRHGFRQRKKSSQTRAFHHGLQQRFVFSSPASRNLWIISVSVKKSRLIVHVMGDINLSDSSSGGDIGNGGASPGGSSEFEHGRSDSSSSAGCLGFSDEEMCGKKERVRAFCCLNVGPVFDGFEWRAYKEEEIQKHEDYWRPVLLPCYIQADIMWQLVKQDEEIPGPDRGCMLAFVKKQIEDWYHIQGYTLAKVTGFTGIKSGIICCRIDEGTITDINVKFKDSSGKETSGKTCKDIILRELPTAVMEGMPYNSSAIKEAIKRVSQLELFENVDVDFKKNILGGVSLDFVAQERLQNGCDFQTGISFFSSESGRPVLSSVRPAATLSVEHRNISGMNRTLHGYIHSNDLLRPQDDSRFKIEYVHQYVDGVEDVRDRTARISCYNSRKLTAVLSNPISHENMPAIWVDRAGLKMNITEKFSKESKLTCGLVIEEVATRDLTGPIQTYSEELLTESGGIEHVPFLQAKIKRDNTRTLNGFRVGAIDTFQVDQGVGLGNKASFFNKHQFSTTRFLPLRRDLLGKPMEDDPFSLIILRARYGGIVGDIPKYRAFTNGGPYALRGSNVGDLGTCTTFLELMSEVRVPVWKQYAYGFVESFTELDGIFYYGQSLKSLGGNALNGIILGMGIKTGDIRTEFVYDCSTRSGSVNLQMGDRI